jgi:hypothetical protein
VQQAVRLASDRDYRETILQELREKSDSLFEDINIVREYERIFRISSTKQGCGNSLVREDGMN